MLVNRHRGVCKGFCDPPSAAVCLMLALGDFWGVSGAPEANRSSPRLRKWPNLPNKLGQPEKETGRHRLPKVPVHLCSASARMFKLSAVCRRPRRADGLRKYHFTFNHQTAQTFVTSFLPKYGNLDDLRASTTSLGPTRSAPSTRWCWSHTRQPGTSA